MSKIPYLTGNGLKGEVLNIITGCSGKGCKAHCWAREMVKRFPAIHGFRSDYGWYGKPGKMKIGKLPYDFGEVQFHPDRLDQPIHWKKPRRVGVCFMGDLFDEQVQFTWVHQIWDIMKACPQHKFFVLTKQPERMAKMVNRIYQLECFGHTDGFWDHVYLGVSITDQPAADRMIPELLKVPGKKWISIEPMLGPITFRKRTLGQGSDCPECGYMVPVDEDGCCTMCGEDAMWYGLDWVVIGCESGPKRRPMPLGWPIDVKNQCAAANIPLYIKQLEIPKDWAKGRDSGTKVSHNPEEWPEELRVREQAFEYA